MLVWESLAVSTSGCCTITYFAREEKVSKFLGLGGLSNVQPHCCRIGWLGLDGLKSRFLAHGL